MDETLDYIYSFTNLEKSDVKFSSNYTLDNITTICNHFGNPQNNLKFIHIAGTKGKGSTSFLITRLLLECGYNTLTFTSPHLIRTNERIQYNMMAIPDHYFIDITNDIKTVLEKNHLIPTTFELFFLIALFYGLRKEVDYFVVETGLGGRFDCTNVIHPEISVITTIGYDHTKILGESIKKISMEKAGIIKRETPVVLSHQVHHCSQYFRDYAEKKQAKLYSVQKLYRVSSIKYTKKGTFFYFKRKNHKKVRFFLPFYGKHQIYNFMTAIEVVSLIYPNLIEHLAIYPTIDLSLNGRVELLKKKNPLVLVDVAHNKESIKELTKTLSSHFPRKKWTLVFSLSDDKDYSTICKIISRIADKIIVTQLSSYKNSDLKQLYQIFSRYHNNVLLIEQQEEAFQSALKERNVLVAGSFYLVGPFCHWMQSNGFSS